MKAFFIKNRNRNKKFTLTIPLVQREYNNTSEILQQDFASLVNKVTTFQGRLEAKTSKFI